MMPQYIFQKEFDVVFVVCNFEGNKMYCKHLMPFYYRKDKNVEQTQKNKPQKNKCKKMLTTPSFAAKAQQKCFIFLNE